MELTPSIPTRLGGGRYLIQEVLGEGGSAWVLLAHDTRMDVNRAIKLLHPRMSHATGNRARFKNEARAQAGLKHPNILMVHDVVEDDDGLYLVMELAEGGSLANRVEKGGPLPVREVIDIGATLCRALQEAHSAGVIHRDIKPGNILVDRSGVIKLADFGIARVLDRDVRLTETGMIIGTWAYMPPEQRDASAPADPRSDIYALGVTLYYLLTGASETNLHNRESHERAFAGLPAGICSVIQRATRMYPDDRYPTCAEFAQDLHLVAQSPELMVADPPTRPVAPAAEGRTLVPRSGQTGPKTPVLQPAITAVPPAPSVPHEPVEAPTPRTSILPWVAAAGVALIGLVSLALAGMILIPRFPPTVVETPPDNPTAAAVIEPPAALPAAPATPPETTVPTAPVPDAPAPTIAQLPSGAPAAPATPTGALPTGTTPPGTTGHTPRVISVLADPGAAASTSPNTPPPIGASSDRIATGTVLLRTIPSGATVSEGGVTLRPGPSGGYDLPVGSHVLDVRSPVGEPTRLPVFVRSGQTVTICHSFDTNSACGSEP